MFELTSFDEGTLWSIFSWPEKIVLASLKPAPLGFLPPDGAVGCPPMLAIFVFEPAL